MTNKPISFTEIRVESLNREIYSVQAKIEAYQSAISASRVDLSSKVFYSEQLSEQEDLCQNLISKRDELKQRLGIQ